MNLDALRPTPDEVRAPRPGDDIVTGADVVIDRDLATVAGMAAGLRERA